MTDATSTNDEWVIQEIKLRERDDRAHAILAGLLSANLSNGVHQTPTDLYPAEAYKLADKMSAARLKVCRFDTYGVLLSEYQIEA